MTLDHSELHRRYTQMLRDCDAKAIRYKWVEQALASEFQYWYFGVENFGSAASG